MKKQIKKDKKLSLNKVQLMKLNDMKTINGGNGPQMNFDVQDPNDQNTPINRTFKTV
ncbi:hypothetical protein [Chryseobacterium rhizosphaerae]|uniref:hypothetical protein n=1 Tax=Chryseobacterium rhizosphaerae TaxID=395937 RepID=UPI0023582D6D|nr:hypothetical protein [Chryseobacterium rhizosphaerae]MDC8098432.1 hypothetical protein [Chryseobacterium rhizosphaerae]